MEKNFFSSGRAVPTLDTNYLIKQDVKANPPAVRGKGVVGGKTESKSTKKVADFSFSGTKVQVKEGQPAMIEALNSKNEMDTFVVSVNKKGEIKVVNSKGITQAKTWSSYKRVVNMVEVVK